MKRLALVSTMIILMAVVTRAQTDGYLEPELIRTPALKLPRAVTDLSGELRVGVNVDASGRVTEVTTVSGPGDICVQVTRADVVMARTAARAAALKAKFKPAISSGQPEAGKGVVIFLFPIHGGKAPLKSNVAEVYNLHNIQSISLPQPTYPPAARAVRASGSVEIQVLIDETGSVFSARAINGHPLLRAVSVSASCEAKFRPALLSGRPVKVSSVITYNFVR